MSFITTVRPSSARLSPSGWFFTSGNPGSVNDSNDSTYAVDFTGGASTIAWYMQIYSLAGNQRCAKATLNSRIVSDSPPLSFNMDAWIRPEGVMGDGATINITSANSPTTFQSTYNSEFSQAALNNLEAWYRDNFGGSTVADIVDIWIDLEIHTQPTVTSVAPTGTGVGLNPTITWANNFQGDTQNANWVRIYRVSDNALIWDSGRVGVRTSQVVGPLATGTQYRAEVFAATDFYGDWWSNTASATFTTNFPPTATVTAPTNTASSLTPTVTWTYSDTEGNAQNQYQVKIFTSAQYGIGGFDPETSPNTWDSTVTAGAATSRVVGTSLVAGAYRAYVKVSDATAGFGAWSFSSFTVVTATMPGTGDLSATATATAQGGTTSMPGVGDLTAFASIPNPCGAMGYAGGSYGGRAVYGGYAVCDAITPGVPPQSTVESNVLDIDDSSGRLGCGEPSFFLTNRCASGVSCILDGLVTAAKWNRALDDVSTAEVTVDLGGDTTFVCCQCLSDTEPWCHELHIWRDGEEVWAGPVQEIEYSYNQVIVRASDSLAWLGVRIPRVHVNPAVAEDITTTAITAIQLAFNEELATYSCEVDNIFSEMTGIVIKLFYEAFHDTYLEILRKIASVGLNFTTIGRTIVLSGSVPALTPLVLLNDEHIIGDIKVTKDGTLMGNRYLVHFDGDSGVPTVAEATDLYCYNAIERLLDGLGLVTGAQAFDTATSYAAAGAIAPRMVVIPPGSRLSPDTPWTINQMVPGARVDVAVTRLCLDLTQSFILTGVEVSYSSGGEEVAITLTPIVDSPTQAGT